MEPKRQREATLAVVVVLLAVVAYAAYQTLSAGPQPSSTATVASNDESRAARRAGRAPAKQQASAEAPQVHLGALGEDRPEPDPRGRDIFRFREKPPPPPPPPVPPITLKFIGVVDAPPPGKRVAVLSDGRGAPVYGHEGETVLGQYRILRIGAESIEMSYLDGRGRQTIRLSGS